MNNFHWIFNLYYSIQIKYKWGPFALFYFLKDCTFWADILWCSFVNNCLICINATQCYLFPHYSSTSELQSLMFCTPNVIQFVRFFTSPGKKAFIIKVECRSMHCELRVAWTSTPSLRASSTHTKMWSRILGGNLEQIWRAWGKRRGGGGGLVTQKEALVLPLSLVLMDKILDWVPFHKWRVCLDMTREIKQCIVVHCYRTITHSMFCFILCFCIFILKIFKHIYKHTQKWRKVNKAGSRLRSSGRSLGDYFFFVCFFLK